MLTAWITISTLLGIAGMVGKLRKGESVVTAVTGFVRTFFLWPVAGIARITVAGIMFVYMVRMKFF